MIKIKGGIFEYLNLQWIKILARCSASDSFRSQELNGQQPASSHQDTRIKAATEHHNLIYSEERYWLGPTNGSWIFRLSDIYPITPRKLQFITKIRKKKKEKTIWKCTTLHHQIILSNIDIFWFRSQICGVFF